MKQARSDLVVFTILASLSSVVGCQHDPQTILTFPRSRAAALSRAEKTRKPRPIAITPAPKPTPLAPANGVDVPIVQPD